MHEIRKEFGAVRCVYDFGVKLHGIEAARFVCDGGERRVFTDGDDLKSRWKCCDPVSVAHPDLMAFASVPDAVKKRACFAHLKHGAAEFAVVAAFDFAAELFGHYLLAVANAKHGNAGIEHGVRRARACGVDHRGWAAR